MNQVKKENREILESIIKVSNHIAKNETDHNFIFIDKDYSKFIRIIMLSREIYARYLNDFMTIEYMSYYYSVKASCLNRILSIGKNSFKNHNYILKLYK